jgi:hypothetical protein
MRTLINLVLVFLLTCSAESVLSQKANQQQTPPTSQGQSSSSAVKSVTGCVVQNKQGFSLKTDTDTYPIDTDKDLSQYVNKQVKVTGILEHHTGAAPSPTSGGTAVITDLRLRMVVTVIGDCGQPSK